MTSRSQIYLFYFFILILSGLLFRAVNSVLLSSLDELVLLSLPFIVLSIRKYKYFSFYIFITSFICMFSDSNLLQLLLDYKLLALVFLLLIFNTNFKVRDVGLVFSLILLLNFFVIIFEFMLPGLYQNLFTGDYNAYFYFNGIEFYRANGIFKHPSELAVFCIIYIFYQLKVLDLNSNITTSNKVYVFIALFSLFLTFQRFEILVAFSFILFYFVFKNRNVNYKFIFIAVLVLFYILYVYMIFYTDHSFDFNDDPRLALYKGSFSMVYDNAFFGSGPGTFGSYLSLNNYTYYDLLGFDDLWWFNEGRYITDTFWPKMFSEYGLLGIIPFLILIYYVTTLKNDLLIFLVYLLIFFFSFQSPIYFDVKFMLMAMILSKINLDNYNGKL